MISLIIPAYMSSPKLVKMTGDCLRSLRENSSPQPDEVILVDDGSPIKIHINPSVQILELPENGGYAAAVNAGMSAAKGDYLVICNNDVQFVQRDWLTHLLKPLKEGYHISSILTTDSDGWITNEIITEGDKFGSIWAITKQAYKTLGPLDVSFGKGYFEDLDYHHRANVAGLRVAKNRAGIVEHLGKATFKENDPDDEYYAAAQKRYEEKNGPVW